MRALTRTLFLAIIAAAAVPGTAGAADDPLLVVVESAPGVSIDARDVRRTIGAELGILVVAPADPTATGASRVLIVAVDRAEIRMSLRANADGLVARTIPAPPDRPARMREIGWLAGNLARDQVSGIVSVFAEPLAPTKELVITAADTPRATEPANVPSPPPTVLPVAGPAREPPATVSARPTEVPIAPQASRWAITVAGGPTAALVLQNGSSTPVRDVTYQLEIQHQASPDALIFGAALDIGTDSPTFGSQLFGIAGIVGSSWYHRHWFLETTAGAGLEVARLAPTTTGTIHTSEAGATSTTTISNEFQPTLYLRGTGTVGLPIATAFDLVARFGIHLSSEGGSSADFVSATAGLRFRLP